MAKSQLFSYIDPIPADTLNSICAAVSDELANVSRERSRGSHPLPSPKSKEDIWLAYNNLVSALKLVTDLQFPRKPVFPGIWQDIPAKYKRIGDVFRNAPPGPGPRATIVDYIVAALNFLATLFEAALLLLDLIVAWVVDNAIYPIRVAIWLLHTVMWLIHGTIYDILAYLGVCYPRRAQLGDGIYSQFLRVPGGDRDYPHREDLLIDPGISKEIPIQHEGNDVATIKFSIIGAHRTGYLRYPLTTPERSTPASPYSVVASPYLEGASVEDFLLACRLDKTLYEEYRKARAPKDTHKLNAALEHGTYPFGNATELGAAFILKEVCLADWNIDADRAHGFKYWRHVGNLQTVFNEGNGYSSNSSYGPPACPKPRTRIERTEKRKQKSRKGTLSR